MGTEKWTPEAIVARLQTWNNRYGVTPRGSDWRHSGADQDGAFPSEATVKAKFGTWNKALKKAELGVRKPGRPSTSDLTKQQSVVLSASGAVNALTNCLPGTTHYPYTYYSYPVYTDTGAQKKLDALKAVLEQDEDTPASVLLAIINA